MQYLAKPEQTSVASAVAVRLVRGCAGRAAFLKQQDAIRRSTRSLLGSPPGGLALRRGLRCGAAAGRAFEPFVTAGAAPAAQHVPAPRGGGVGQTARPAVRPPRQQPPASSSVTRRRGPASAGAAGSPAPLPGPATRARSWPGRLGTARQRPSAARTLER